jgi:dTDP-4-dehydrorhamnose reductase
MTRLARGTGPAVILGHRGTLGHQFAHLLPGTILWDREEVDVTDFAQLEREFLRLQPSPSLIVNCIAFNDVDGAEQRPEAAFALNAEYVGRLALLADAVDAVLVHYSTNYVFDGAGGGEFMEKDPPNPLSIYGKSKRRGEELALENSRRCYVIRTAVVFGPKGPSVLSKKSFVDVMLELSLKTDAIRAVADEVNSITYAPDLANATAALVDSGAPAGIYHLTNSGHASWYELAREIFRITDRRINLEPVPSSSFPRKAIRPARAVLINHKATPLRPWQAALAEYLNDLRRTGDQSI